MTFSLDTGDGARVPIRTTAATDDHLVKILMEQERQTVLLQKILHALTEGSATSSVELEMDSKGQVKPKVKAYETTVETAADMALDTFGRCVREIDARQQRAWADTLEMVQRERGEP